jgi:hypothetical protein
LGNNYGCLTGREAAVHVKYNTTPTKTYDAVNQCIYCDSSESLSDEHIFPYGLGGRLVLPKASCSKCAKTTGKFEQNCLKKLYGVARHLLGIPSRKKGMPKNVPISQKSRWGGYISTEVPLMEYPAFLIDVKLDGPPLITVGIEPSSSVCNFAARLSIVSIKKDAKQVNFKRELNFQTIDYARMLAKIALAYAVGELGLTNFKPLDQLLKLIKNETPYDTDYCVGGSQLIEPLSNNPHEIRIEFDCDKKGNKLVVVLIRLFSQVQSTSSSRIVVGYKAQDKCLCNSCILNCDSKIQ